MLRPSVRHVPSPMLLVVLSLGLPGACRGPAPEDPAGQTPRWEQVGQYVARSGGHDAIVYQAQANPYKPYVQQLRTPAGVQILRDSPDDHVHHHALMFALRADETNFWEENDHPGTEAPTATRVEGDTLYSTLAWRDEAGATLLDEERQLQYSPHPTATRLTWRSTLTPAAGRDSVALSGAHYHGLGMRFVTSIDGRAHFVHPAGVTFEVVRGTERLMTGDWAACAALVEGREVTVVMMTHPDEVLPTRWFTMTAPFAYLAATCDGWREPVSLRRGETLEFVFGVALFDRHVGSEQIQAHYDRWVAATLPPRSTVVE